MPEFPTSHPLTLQDKPLLDTAFALQQPELSQYTFTNIFAWRKARHTQVSELDGMTLLGLEQPGRRVYLEPIGEGHAREVIERCLDGRDQNAEKRKADVRPERDKNAEKRDAKSESPDISAFGFQFSDFCSRPRSFSDLCVRSGCEFAYLPWNTVAMFQGAPDYVIELDRDNSDYLYLTSDLIELAGRKYDAKRNFVRRFQSEHEYRYLPMTSDIARECRKFEEHWCEDRSCQSDEGLSHEMEAVMEMLDNFEALSYRGGALEVGGAIAAFSLGEKLNNDTFVVHVEKADAKLTGIYAAINNEFCRHEAAGFKYVNREQDLGIPGLRQAKLSYHPVRMIDCYRLRRA